MIHYLSINILLYLELKSYIKLFIKIYVSLIILHKQHIFDMEQNTSTYNHMVAPGQIYFIMLNLETIKLEKLQEYIQEVNV